MALEALSQEEATKTPEDDMVRRQLGEVARPEDDRSIEPATIFNTAKPQIEAWKIAEKKLSPREASTKGENVKVLEAPHGIEAVAGQHLQISPTRIKLDDREFRVRRRLHKRLPMDFK
jgi:hypothetical protein